MATTAKARNKASASKNSAKQPIGRGKKNSGKRILSTYGRGKKALKTWRSLPKSQRKQIKALGFVGMMDAIGEVQDTKTRARAGNAKAKPTAKSGGTKALGASRNTGGLKQTKTGDTSKLGKAMAKAGAKSKPKAKPKATATHKRNVKQAKKTTRPYRSAQLSTPVRKNLKKAPSLKTKASLTEAKLTKGTYRGTSGGGTGGGGATNRKV